jgi:hypothetical protein
MKCLALILVVATLFLTQGCVEEKINDANFKWSTNNSMPVAPKTTTYGTTTPKFSSPTADTKYRSMGLNDVMGHER